MKLLMTFFILVSNLAFSNANVIEKAPFEWLVTATLQEKINSDGHLEENDPLVKEIFNSINYDPETDQILKTSNKKTDELSAKLKKYLKTIASSKAARKVDPKYLKYLKEKKRSPIPVTLFRSKKQVEGIYFFNHIHTNISQDNADLKWLKITPKKTFQLVEKFLKRRGAKGVVTFTDHDTDIAFDHISHIKSSHLTPLRGVEWGGRTHMNLIDIKKDWKELSNGRNYEKEESVIKSRSSNGFRVVNHPNRKKPFPYKSWLDADGVEVWNTILENSPFLAFKIDRSNNRDALKQWVESLQTGKQYTAMSGSDFHFTIPCLNERTLIYPVNYIPDTDISKVRENLFKGRLSFVTRPTAPKLSIKAKFNKGVWARMGDELKGNGKLDLEIFGDFSDGNKRIGGACYNVVNSFYKLITFWKKQRWQLRVYNLKGDLVAKRNLNPKRFGRRWNLRAELKLPISGKDLVRVELWSINRGSKSIDLLGATNPIYLNW